jgi:hypothetical protein
MLHISSLDAPVPAHRILDTARSGLHICLDLHQHENVLNSVKGE